MADTLPALDPTDYLSHVIPGIIGLILLYPLIPVEISGNILEIDGVILLPVLVALSYVLGLVSNYFASNFEAKHPYDELNEKVGNERTLIENRFFKYAPEYFDITYTSLGLYFRARSELYSKGDRGDETQKLESLYLLFRGLSFTFLLFGIAYLLYSISLGLDGSGSLLRLFATLFVLVSVFLFIGSVVSYKISKKKIPQRTCEDIS